MNTESIAASAAKLLAGGHAHGTRASPGWWARVFRSGVFVVAGFGTSILLRLVSNLVLTRLLFPEAFGLMAIVQTVLLGLHMLSDAGIEQSILQNHRGDDPDFVNTAWTVQAIRGALLWILICALAAPLSVFYGDPMLVKLLPAVGSSAFIAGLASTKIALADRNLALGKTTAINVGSYALQLVVTIVWAWFDTSVWSLVVGQVVGTTAKTVVSHLWLDGVDNRFALDASSLRVLLRFGSWIFIGSTLSFLAGEGNRLLLGRLLDFQTLGFLSIAMAMDQLPRQIMQQVGARVLFPAYAEAIRTRMPELPSVVLRSRLIHLLPCWLVCVFFAFLGRHFMHLLYDNRYHDAGWMLQFLALGSLAGLLGASYNSLLLARGLVRVSTILLAVQMTLQILMIALGAHWGGTRGVVAGIALSSWTMSLAHAYVFSRLGLWQAKTDLVFIIISALVALLVLAYFNGADSLVVDIFS